MAEEASVGHGGGHQQAAPRLEIEKSMREETKEAFVGSFCRGKDGRRRSRIIASPVMLFLVLPL